MPLLDITGLKTEIRLKRAVVHALDGVDLAVERGQCVGLVGESGSGKTMTAMSIMQLLPNGGHLTDGKIMLEDRDLRQFDNDQMRKIRGNEIGMIFQDPMTSLNPTMTVGNQIAETVRLHRGASKAEAMGRAIETLELVGMPSPKRRALDYPHQLSGGMRQRAMIAMALACEPKLLIADEPTTALDVTIQKQILELIDELRQRLGMSVILVTHDLGVIAGRADKICVMYAGRIVETTSTEALFANPRHPYTEALFESLPETGADRGTRLYSIPGMPPDLTLDLKGCRFAPRCRYAQDKCRETEPVLTGETELHKYACFFPVGAEEKVAGNRVVAVEEVKEPEGEPLPESNIGQPILDIRHLIKDFPITAGAVLQRKVGTVSAVADVSLTIRTGETFGLVGESGCGKTTIGRLVVGLEKVTGGHIFFQGEDLTKLSERQMRKRRRKIQLMFQDSYASMDPRMRVGAILREPMVIQGIGNKREQLQRIEQLLDEVGLPRTAVQRYAHEFSGGQRQRLGLARALALRPDLVVADEPVSALDVSIQSQVLNLMLDLQKVRELTYIFISHDLSVVRYLSDRIGVMYLGKMVEVGPASAVYARPVHHYTKGLIDTVPTADPVAEKAKAHEGIKGELPSAIDPPSGCRFRTRCPAAQDLCAQEEPPLRAFSLNGHRAACHFPLREPEAGASKLDEEMMGAQLLGGDPMASPPLGS
ncbi:MAG TPA: ABC transporter ATP-binding protein [Streptosporangiaceae bacterium]